MSNPSFPELSRKPALRTGDDTLDPTLRDTFENGMESTRAKFTRMRNQSNWAIDFLTPDDVTELQYFVQNVANYGATIFLFEDLRDPTNPVTLTVRFSSLPKYMDAGWVGDSFRRNCTFQLRTV